MRGATLILAALLAASPASAQDRPERPFLGLFGPGAGGNDGQTLDLKVSLFGAYDDNLTADAGGGGGVSQALQVSGIYSGFAADLNYALRSDAITLAAAAQSSMRYQDALAEPWMGSHGASLSLSAKLGRRGSLSLVQQASYTPYQVLDLFPTASGAAPGVPVAFDWRVGLEDRFGYGTRASVSHEIGARSGVLFSYDYGATRGSQDAFNLDSHGLGGGWHTRIGRWAGLNLGYGLRLADYAAAGAATRRIHDIDIGATYARPLSFSRRTHVSFSSGAAVMEDGAQRRYNAIGNADIVHEIGRTWSLRGAYRRDASFVEAFPDPLFTDGVTLSLGGLANRRLRMSAGGGFSNGTVGYDAAQRIETWNGTARLELAVSRPMAVSVEYFYFHYDFARTIQLPDGVSHRAERQGVRVGLTLWAPIVGSRRTR